MDAFFEPDEHADGGAECDTDTLRTSLTDPNFGAFWRSVPDGSTVYVNGVPYTVSHVREPEPVEYAITVDFVDRRALADFFADVPHHPTTEYGIHADGVCDCTYGPEPDADVRRALGEALSRSTI